MADLPCKNPNCKSHGIPHPNCRCYEAHGGEIKHFCDANIPHEPECEYFADGGHVGTPEPPPTPVHPAVTLGHAAAHHGLLGILKDVGQPNLQNPEKHHKTLEKVKHHLSNGESEKAIDSLHGHPLTGRAARGKVEPMVHRLGPELMSKDVDANAFRSAADFLHSAMKGNDALDNHLGQFFDHQKSSEKIKTNEHHRKELDELLKKKQENPQELLDIGGSLGHYLPDHAAAVGALASGATDYLNALRPKEKQLSPLDEPIPPDDSVKEAFNRHLDIAQNPLIVLQHMKQGSLLPGDIKTLQTLYPGLHHSIVGKTADALIDAKAKNKNIPYEQAVSMGMILGQPLDSTMVPENMQAIIRANGGSQDSQQQMPQKKSQNKPTAAQIKQIDKTDKLYETPIESRQIDRK